MLIAVFCLIPLSSCVQKSLSSTTYQANETQTPQQITTITIIQIRAIKIQREVNQNANVGGGAAIGGASGYVLGNSSTAALGGAALGALAGGIANIIQSNTNGVQITYTDVNGHNRILVQQGNIAQFKLGIAQMTIANNYDDNPTYRILPNA